MFGGLKKLLGRAEAQINPFDHGATFNNPHPNQGQASQGFGSAVGQSLQGAQPFQQLPAREQFMQTLTPQGDPTGQFPGAPQVPMGQDPANYGYPPDITVDPTGQTPYSARTSELAQLGNLYTANPFDPRVMHMDPKLFGYPPDNSSLGMQAPSLSQNLQDLLRRR